MASITQRNGKWRVQIRKKGQKPQFKTFTYKDDAERYAKSVEVEIEAGNFVDRRAAEGTTLYAALERYERDITPRKKGAKQERVRIAAWKRDPLSSRSLASLKGSDFADWRDKRLAAGVTSTTVRNDLALPSHLFNVAAREWGMESLVNPIDRIRVPTAARARDRRLVGDEEKRLLKACDARVTWLGPLVRLALATGMRQGELLSLHWERIDMRRRVARLLETKNGDIRDVPLSTTALQGLKKLKPKKEGPVFPVGSVAVDKQWRNALETAKIEGLRFHDLRHEATSRLFERDLNPMKVAAITGHKTLQMLKRYTHLRAEDLAKELG